MSEIYPPCPVCSTVRCPSHQVILEQHLSWPKGSIDELQRLAARVAELESRYASALTASHSKSDLIVGRDEKIIKMENLLAAERTHADRLAEVLETIGSRNGLEYSDFFYLADKAVAAHRERRDGEA